MGFYSDFVRATERDGVKRVYWISGEEDVLKEATISKIKEVSGVDAEHTRVFSLDEDTDDEAWAFADTHGLDDQPRLCIIRQAEKLQDFDRLMHWADYRGGGATLRHVILVLVTSLPDWPMTRNVAGEPVYYRADVRAALVKWRSSMLVQCTVKSTRAAAECVSTWLDCPDEPGTAEWLYLWLGGDLTACRDAAMAVAPFRRLLEKSGKPFRVDDLLKTYVAPAADKEFIQSLESMDKQKAMASAVHIPASQYRGTVSWLAADLEVLGRIRRVQQPGLGNQELANRLRLHRIRVDTLRPYAKYYDQQKTAECAQVLVQAESLLKAGADKGILELVTALW